MKEIILLGSLGKKYGRVHKFAVRNVAEAVRALSANFKGFRNDFIGPVGTPAAYKVLIGDRYAKEDSEISTLVGQRESITLIPVIAGAESRDEKIFFGAMITAVGIITAPYGGGFLIPIGVSLALSGVMQLLAVVPKGPVPGAKEEEKASYLFNGPVNTTVQGYPVPVCYGRMTVGSAVISARITVEEIYE